MLNDKTKNNNGINSEIELKILQQIINGVTLEDGTTRPFNLLDYYKITNVSFKKFFNRIKSKLTVHEIRQFHNFAVQYTSELWEERQISQYYKTKITLRVKFTEDDKLIPNSGYTLSLEEKKLIISYLQMMNIPISQRSINLVQNEYLDGHINIYEDLKQEKELKKEY